MNERYSKLFALPQNLYSEGAPVLIAAGALLKDNEIGKVLAQLKIQNISGKPIKAATVKLAPADTTGKPLGDEIQHQYLDLNAGRDADFGQKTPVSFPDASTRGFVVSVSEVIFADNTTWTDSNTPWEPLSSPAPLDNIGDTELVKQYRMRYGTDCKYIFKQEKDLWHCACGAVNHREEAVCHRCGKEATVLSTVDMEELKAERDERLAAAEAKIAKTKATTKRAAPFVIVAIILLVAVGLFASHIIKMQNYPARTLYDYICENGTYSEEVSLPFYTEASTDTPIIFSGYAVELSNDNTPNMLKTGSNTCNILVEKKNRGVFWYQSHAGNADFNVDFIARLTCTSKEKSLAYTCTIGNVITLPGGKANIVFHRSIDLGTDNMADNAPIDDVWLQSPEMSSDELSDFPITEPMKESYAGTITSQTAIFLANFTSYLQGKTDVTIADFGFPDEVSAYSPNELSDRLLETLMAQSFDQAYTLLSTMPADNDTVKEYKALIEKYLPYCGNFTEAEVMINDKERATDDYTLISDFYLASSGEVYWKADSSDGSGNIYIGSGKHYPFISAWDEQMLVDDTMTVEYDFDEGYSDYHCKATFQNGEIVVTVTDNYNVEYGWEPKEVSCTRYTE